MVSLQVGVAPQLSVVIPVRGRSRPLRDCLAALGRQPGAPPFEVIVVDDGSPHALDAATLRHQFGDPRAALRLVRQPPSGTSAARNRGIQEAQGQLLVFIDSDVLPREDFLRALAASAALYPDAVAFQAALGGERARLSWRVEGARLTATQRLLTTPRTV